MNERLGVLAAVLSSALGGMAAATTRFVIGATDPITLGVLRYGGGFVLLLPLALKRRWPSGRDWIGVILLGLLFFGLFPVLFNAALARTTAARGSLALSTLPLLTMLFAAALRVERLDARKSAGVLIAMTGVGAALAAGLADAPAGAWRGDLLMVAAASLMALYSVLSRPYIARSGPISFTTAGMGVGAGSLAALAWMTGGFAAPATFGAAQWIAAAYLGVFGGAVAFYLWAFALERTTPTRVANTIAVNPISASLLASVLMGESIGFNLIIGIAAVSCGIWIAATDRAPSASAEPEAPERNRTGPRTDAIDDSQMPGG